MKKIIHSAFVVAFATLLFSCQKQGELEKPSSASRFTDGVKQESTWPVRVPHVRSNWFAVKLEPNKDGGLYGSYELSKPLVTPTDTEIKIAYVRRENYSSLTDGGCKFSYHRLPAALKTPFGFAVFINFALSDKLFEISITQDGSTPVPRPLEPGDFNSYNFRYIVIAKSDYENMNVDWDDYLAVADILGFAP